MTGASAILDRLVRLDTYVREIREFDGVVEDDYLADGKGQDALERRLQLATEVCLDMAEAVIAGAGARAARDYVDLFRVLGEESVLDLSLVTRMQTLAR